MTRRTPALLARALLLLALLGLSPNLSLNRVQAAYTPTSSGAALSALPLLTSPASSASPASFAHAAFGAVWDRTDLPVAGGQVKRTWFWGPQANTGGLLEDYKEGQAGKRLVQYFDKSRMELNNPGGDPSSPFYVTNGLLTVELISGRMQTGNNSFASRQPSLTNVTGDAGDALAPTYADFADLSNALTEHRSPNRTGQPATATLARGGKTGDDPSRAGVASAKNAYYEPVTGHNIPQAMWDFLNSSGPVNVSGKIAQQKLIEPWFYASGYPISEAYWVQATILGKSTGVLVQAFERRVLTYVPTNPTGFQVEMGNIGQHYYAWRYTDAGPTPAPTAQSLTPTPTSQPITTTAQLPIPRYAVDLASDITPQTMASLKKLGAEAVRLYTPWFTIEPNEGAPASYNWGATDAQFRTASDAGLQSIALIVSCPRWACPAGNDGPIPASKLGSFAAFMAAMSAHYSQAPYNVHLWEMFNEPDNTGGPDKQLEWGMHGAEYAAMLHAVSVAVKAVDPNARIIMGGVAYDNFTENNGPFWRPFVDDVLAAGGGKSLDAFNFHYYVQNVNWCSMSGKLGELRAKLNAHGLSSLPVVSTESGLTSDEAFNSSPELQSIYVAQLYAQAMGEGMSMQTWFLAKDFTTNVKGWKLFQKSGLLDLSGMPKPSSNAYSFAVNEFGQRSGLRLLKAGTEIPAGYHGYEFGPDSAHAGKLWVLWAWNIGPAGQCGEMPQPAPYTLPAGLSPAFKAAYDIYGHPVAISTGGGTVVTFSVGTSPVYVEWR